jgi:mono/diheme cytochrome c family protein
MRTIVTSILTSLLFFTALTVNAAEPLLAYEDKQGSLKPPFDLSDTTRINIGKRRFNSVCAAYCHGAEGDGGKVTAFKGNLELKPEIIYNVVLEGRRGAGIMPPWGKTYTSAEIWELTAYIHHLTKQPPTVK